jgi:hypothetical protein
LSNSNVISQEQTEINNSNTDSENDVPDLTSEDDMPHLILDEFTNTVELAQTSLQMSGVIDIVMRNRTQRIEVQSRGPHHDHNIVMRNETQRDEVQSRRPRHRHTRCRLGFEAFNSEAESNATE